MSNPTDPEVSAFLAAVEPAKRQKDALVVRTMMERLTNWRARMCGTSIIGFGTYHYKYANGGDGSALVVGFSPRKTSLVLYIMGGFSDYEDLMRKLGKYKTGKCCLYINKLEDIDQRILEKLILQSVDYMKEKYRC